ncbi:hypothetical protein [Burkholderia cepacia]|uniref:hypothetical protein n=1 Tax=Burkholderia cepacia TaxID=292 RepID=UPI0012D93904|nr:hypothetical protein [Burkholderia cepacia]
MGRYLTNRARPAGNHNNTEGPMNSLQTVFPQNRRSFVSITQCDWFPIAAIGALLLLAGFVAPPIEYLMGAWS